MRGSLDVVEEPVGTLCAQERSVRASRDSACVCVCSQVRHSLRRAWCCWLAPAQVRYD